MTNIENVAESRLSRKRAEIGQAYLSTTGAVEEPWMLRNADFARDMLETVFQGDADDYEHVSDRMVSIAVDYMTKHADTEDPRSFTSRAFAEGLLNQVLGCSRS